MSHAFKFEKWATVTPADKWQFVAGNFTGSGLNELVGYHPDNGSLWVGKNTGSSFKFQKWATVTPADKWQFVAGNFTGSGLNELVGYHPDNGSLWVGKNTGSSFKFQKWATVTPADKWQFIAGNFTGSGLNEIVGYHPDNGSLWVGKNTGSSFKFQKWATVTPADKWQFVAGNFTGSGLNEIVGYHPNNGSLWVGKNTGSSFKFQKWATVTPADKWQFVAGNFTGNNLDDVVGYHPNNGSLWAGKNTGSSFSFQKWGEITPIANWQFIAGRFDPDLVGYHPSDGTVWYGRSGAASSSKIEGYCWPLSAAPGEEISFKISGNGNSRAAFYRHLSTDETIESILMNGQTEIFTPFSSSIQSIPAEVWSQGCNWRESFKLKIPEFWPSGIYSARCSDYENSTNITFIVKPDPQEKSQVALLANVNTWLAYNSWGGRSAYTVPSSARLSFLRPNHKAAFAGSGNTDAHLTRGELWVLGWLEKEGYNPDVYTDIDFHSGFDINHYKCLILSTHPEYWSEKMYDKLSSYLDAGGSLIYLGGNGIYEKIYYESEHTIGVFRGGVDWLDKNNPIDNRTEVLFRSHPGKHERSLLGVATERCGVTGTPYEVIIPDHPFFKETGLNKGDTFGNSGLNNEENDGYGNGKASGWEVDTFNGPGANRLKPLYCGNYTQNGSVDMNASPLPEGLIILAKGQEEEEGEFPGKGADMIYYDHAGGGFVFSAGSLTFGGSLVVDSKIQQIVHNILQKAILG